MDLSLSNGQEFERGPITFDLNGTKAELLPPTPGKERPGHQGEAEMIRLYREGQAEPVEFHLQDYKQLYAESGLYREVVQRRLKCQSPDRVAFALVNAVTRQGGRAKDLKVLDLAAGDGFSSSALYRRGVNSIVGADYYEIARTAAQREHPLLYPADQDNYLVKDISREDHIADIAKVVGEGNLNALSCAGALGHLPFEGFKAVWDSFPDGAYLSVSFYDALNEDLPPIEEETEFLDYLRAEMASGRVQLLEQDRFDHRLAMDGSVFRGALIVAQKTSGKRE